ncbi:MAG: HepT-like ribonuclease domain-containing protein [Thermomicrobiales bacterium]
MTPETAKRLLDARQACALLTQILSDESLDSYLDNVVLELAVQKLLENIGEALSQIRRSEPTTSEMIPDMHRYIGLRNHVSHGYDSVSYDILWTVAKEEVPKLASVLDRLLLSAPPPENSDSHIG